MVGVGVGDEEEGAATMVTPAVVSESCRAPWSSAITALPGDGNISSLSILFFFPK
jgi:hypothetical protein